MSSCSLARMVGSVNLFQPSEALAVSLAVKQSLAEPAAKKQTAQRVQTKSCDPNRASDRQHGGSPSSSKGVMFPACDKFGTIFFGTGKGMFDCSPARPRWHFSSAALMDSTLRTSRIDLPREDRMSHSWDHIEARSAVTGGNTVSQRCWSWHLIF